MSEQRNWQRLLISLLPIVLLSALFIDGTSNHKSPYYHLNLFLIAGGVVVFLWRIENLRKYALRKYPQRAELIHMLFWDAWNVLVRSLAVAAFFLVYFWAREPEDGTREPVVTLFGSVTVLVEWARRTFKHIIEPTTPFVGWRPRYRRRYRGDR